MIITRGYGWEGIEGGGTIEVTNIEIEDLEVEIELEDLEIEIEICTD